MSLKNCLGCLCGLLCLIVLPSCVQVQTGNDVIDATSAVATGVYLQKKKEQREAKSAKIDPFPKKVDPKVQAIDAAIEKARKNQFSGAGQGTLIREHR